MPAKKKVTRKPTKRTTKKKTKALTKKDLKGYWGDRAAIDKL